MYGNNVYLDFVLVCQRYESNFIRFGFTRYCLRTEDFVMFDPAQKCKKCGEDLAPGARFCESCRHPVSEVASKGETKFALSSNKKRYISLAAISIVFLLAGYILGIQSDIIATKSIDLNSCDEHRKVGEYFDALACYDKIIADSRLNNSTKEIAYRNKGDILFTIGDSYISAQAADCYKESYRKGGNQSSLIRQGLCLYQAMKFADAVDRLNEVENKSCDCRIFKALSESYNKIGNPERGNENNILYQKCTNDTKLARNYEIK